MPLGTIEIREGFGPLELSEGFSTVWSAPFAWGALSFCAKYDIIKGKKPLISGKEGIACDAPVTAAAPTWCILKV